jgi:hypothetical protein
MGQLPFINTIPDSLQIDFEPQYSVQYSAEFNNYSRLAAENTVSSSFFDSTYIKTTSHTDSVRFRRFSHIVQLNAFENNNRKFTFSKRVFAENEIVNASHPIPYGIRSYTYSNVYVGGEIARSTSDFWKWSANARFAVLGRNLGDAIIKGNISKDIHFANDTSHIEIEAHYSDIRADIFQEHWQSNHFKWENNFKKQHEVVFKAAFSYPEYLLSTGANYALFSNYLYNNEYAMPAQYNSEFSVISAWINKDFVLGKFCWSGKIVWQQLSNNAVLHLPAISVYSSIYYSHYLFKVMKIQLGADVYYHSPFYANKYEPSSTRFYLQNERKTGGYPVINLYANAKLKRTSAFAQVVHANSMFKIGEFFSVPGYPLEQAAFRFGFIWTFYD